jgi:DNA polymerase III subunit epsilon
LAPGAEQKEHIVKVFWFDCETTGLDPARHGIVSLAYLVEIDGRLIAEGELKNNPVGKELDEKALKLNGFTPADIATFPTSATTKLELEKLFARFVSRYEAGDKFVAGGYNVRFDLEFLRQLWADQGDVYFGSWFGFPVIDPGYLLEPMRYAGILPKLPPKVTLSNLAENLGITLFSAHDALADIRATREIALELIARMKQGVPA